MISIEERVKNEHQANENGVRKNHGRLRRKFSHVWECPNSLRVESAVRNLSVKAMPGRDVLEIGCGSGGTTSRYAKLGPRRLVGIDIEEQALEDARQYVPSAEFFLMDAHRTPFEAASFDVICGRAILHHLDFQAAIQEISRLLRPGGYAFFLEPLRDNPASKIARSLTPHARTLDELPLSRQQIIWANAQFRTNEHKFYGLLSAGLGLLTSLTPLKADNTLLRLADKADVALSKTYLKYWMRFALLTWRN